MCRILLFISLCLAISSCKNDSSKSSQQPASVSTEQDYRIINRAAHDPKAFTQGLEYHNGVIHESTGQYSTSWISTYDLSSLQYDKKVILDKKYFGEGITILNGKIYQLTYKSGIMMIYDAYTYERINTHDYSKDFKEGWGLTNDGNQLIASDGTSNLYFIDTNDYSIQKKLSVSKGVSSVTKLNELEYVDGIVYANIWQSNTILKIDTVTGEVIRDYDLSNLLKSLPYTKDIDVLNGIAYNDEKGTFYVTGKYWPSLFEIELLESKL